MQVWAVTYNPDTFTDQIYQNGLVLVDPESQARIKKFYRREDACRCLIGRLLPRMLLKERGILKGAMTFATTQAGKPYIRTPSLDPPLAFNVSHDNALVAMVAGPGEHDPPAYKLGVDVMKVELPKRESFPAFVRIFSDQLTPRETQAVLSVPQAAGVQLFFWIWTMKEAYTKALGLGLGFDFSRIEYDVARETLTVDGETPLGWQFIKFELGNERNGEQEAYQGVAARYTGGNVTDISAQDSKCGNWLVHYDAAAFVTRAIQELA